MGLNYLRSTMDLGRLSNLAILSIEHEISGEINFKNVEIFSGQIDKSKIVNCSSEELCMFF